MNELLFHLAPRYIFVAGAMTSLMNSDAKSAAADLYYERLPWSNRFQNVARFYALAPLNNTTKAKVTHSTSMHTSPVCRPSMRSASWASSPPRTSPPLYLPSTPPTPSPPLPATRPLTMATGASGGGRRTSRAPESAGSACRIQTATRTWSFPSAPYVTICSGCCGVSYATSRPD